MDKIISLGGLLIAGYFGYQVASKSGKSKKPSKQSDSKSLVSSSNESAPPKNLQTLSVTTYTRATLPEVKKLYPPIEPYDTGFLEVGDGHKIYYEQCGKPDGKPIVVLHGGPGGGIAAFYRQMFDPNVYRIVLFDQRGAGKSLPYASLENNTTWHLVDDTEKLKKHLGIEKWVVFGGSWGSTLSLAYSQTYPDSCKGLILRGIFMCRRNELLWFYQEGASYMFPDAWDKYIEPIPIVERGDFMSAYYRRVTGSDEKEKLRAAKAWSSWEMHTSRLYVDPALVAKGEEDEFAIAFARIESHYFVHGAFFRSDQELLENAHKIAHLPCVIVQGRYDLVCPPISAWELHNKLPKSKMVWVEDAGHSMSEPGIISELVKATDDFRSL